MYAFTQVAIYGKTYCQAAKDTWQLVKSHGVGMFYFTAQPRSDRAVQLSPGVCIPDTGTLPRIFCP